MTWDVSIQGRVLDVPEPINEEIFDEFLSKIKDALDDVDIVITDFSIVMNAMNDMPPERTHR